MNKEKYEILKENVEKNHPYVFQNPELAFEFFINLKIEISEAQYIDYGKSQIIIYDNLSREKFCSMLDEDIKRAEEKIKEAEKIKLLLDK